MIGIDLGWLLFALISAFMTTVPDDLISKVFWMFVSMYFIYISFSIEDDDDDDDDDCFRRHSSLYSGV